ncbi:unnamed protein product [Parnassius apollo]|uniref:(apollo) hypothetical protein n=1 Tax=Parnassius apollo TaxID=110799 RepID=A0A8S3XLW4_PARAO|nr:unnamed protein product [Parnassius apollo]
MLKDLKIEEALGEIFGLPDNLKLSDNNVESEEEEQFNIARLESILAGLDDNDDTNNPEAQAERHNINSSQSPSSSRVNCVTGPLPIPPVLPTNSDTKTLSPERPLSPDRFLSPERPLMPGIYDESSDSDQFDADEGEWKKVNWTFQFDKTPVLPKRRFNNRTKPVPFIFLKASLLYIFTTSYIKFVLY